MSMPLRDPSPVFVMTRLRLLKVWQFIHLLSSNVVISCVMICVINYRFYNCK